MKPPRRILTILAIIAAPFVVLIGLFLIIHSLLYDGSGPDDGEGMTAMMIALPAAFLTAICGWTVAIIYGVTSWHGRDKKKSEADS